MPRRTLAALARPTHLTISILSYTLKHGQTPKRLLSCFQDFATSCSEKIAALTISILSYTLKHGQTPKRLVLLRSPENRTPRRRCAVPLRKI